MTFSVFPGKTNYNFLWQIIFKLFKEDGSVCHLEKLNQIPKRVQMLDLINLHFQETKIEQPSFPLLTSTRETIV